MVTTMRGNPASWFEGGNICLGVSAFSVKKLAEDYTCFTSQTLKHPLKCSPGKKDFLKNKGGDPHFLIFRLTVKAVIT